LFSKAGALRNPEEAVLPALSQMDEARFQSFAARLTELRSTTGKGPAGGG
jgi:hypothetical protein